MNKNLRILVTGAKGQLGYDCVRELKERGYTDIVAVDIDVLDITDENAVHIFVNEKKPNVIMHNAAYTAVDKAEENRDACYKVNVLGTKYLAESAEEVGAKLIYISTDYVFPGDGDEFYEVDDQIGPISVYGQTKYEGEQVSKACSKLFIVRVSWVFGINGNNFIKTMLKLSETHKELTIVSDQIGSPTYTYDLSKLLCDMIETDRYGTYHATNEGVCSWAEFAQEIFKVTNKNVLVRPITTEEYFDNKPIQAKRPLNSRMSKKSLDAAGFKRLPNWQDALKRFIKTLRGSKKWQNF